MATNKPRDFTPDGIRSVVERLRAAREQLEGVADGMDQRDMPSLEVVNATRLEEYLKRVEGFVAAALHAYHEHRMNPPGKDS